MDNLYFKTDLAIFELDSSRQYYEKKYLPEFSYLAQLDFQNSRIFENQAPFYCPRNTKSQFENIKVQKLIDWQTQNQFENNYSNQCFDISFKIIDAIKKIHNQNIICGAISSSNILIDNELNVWFSEWSLANILGKNHVDKSVFLETSLVEFISPEQTNRNESKINFKTDLYSLGVVLYHLFTNFNPFASDNKFDSIYKHRTYLPFLPNQKNKEIGLVTAKAILKLIEKNPENRFLNIEFTEIYFRKAFELFKKGEINESIDFEIQIDYLYDINRLLQSVYNHELELFNEYYLKALQQNAGLVTFVEGKNGIQKSIFINNFFNKLETDNVLTVSVSLKDDENKPLASIVELIKTISNYYLTRPNDELLNFQNILTVRLGVAINILHEIYPNLNQILPISSEKPDIKGFDLRSQLTFAIAEFLKSFIQSQKQLIIHFRGFHLINNNTFSVIDGLLKELPLEKLVFIFSYEEDLLPENQRNFIKNQLDKSSNLLTFEKLSLFPIQKNQLEEILKVSKISQPALAFTTDILIAKSSGLPSLINRIVKELIDNGKVIFDYATNFWQIEKESLLLVNNYSDKVSDYYEKQYQSFDYLEKQLLKTASLIGEVIPIEVLMACDDVTSFDFIFKKLLGEGIFKYLDKDEEISLVDADFGDFCLNQIEIQEKTIINEKIVEAYLLKTTNIIQSEFFYRFLNKILSLPIDKTLKYREWLKNGAANALKIADFDRCFACNQMLFNQISEFDWLHNQNDAFNSCIEYMSACSLCLQFDNAEDIYHLLLKKKVNETQFLYLTWQFVEGLLLKSDFERSIDISINALHSIDIHLAKNPSIIKIIYSSIRMNLLMKGKDLTFFKNLPVITDDREIYKIRILQNMVGSAFISNPKMIPELVYKQAGFSIKNGFSLNLAICLSCYAFMSANYQKKYKEAKHYFRLAQDINLILKDSRSNDVNMFLYSGFIQPWFDSFKKTTQQLLENFQLCRQTGYVNLALYNSNFIAYQIIFNEENIVDIKNKIIEILPFINTNTPLHGNDSIIIAMRFLQEIGPIEEDYLTYFFKAASIKELTARLLPDKDSIKPTFLFNCQFYLNYLTENYKVDIEELKLCQKMYLSQGDGYYLLYINSYFASLNFLKLKRKLTNFENNFVKKTIKVLYQSAKIIPKNFESKALLLDALFDLKQNNDEKGNIKLQKAFETALKYEQFLSVGLIARELGIFYEKIGLINQSISYFRLAIKYFAQNGAEKLVVKIEERNELLKQKQEKTLNFNQKIDFQSFINASISISAEIKLDSLLEKLLLVMAENAGAETVYFILPQQSGFELIASKTQENIKTNLHEVVNENNAPLSILHFVQRSKQYLLLDNASKNQIYKNGPYIRSNNIISILCLPVVKNNQLIGIIYLENNLIANAFSIESTDTLNLLASQIAISFENSQLYNNMEKKVLERTNELLIEKDKSDKLLLNILPSEVAEELKEFGHSEAKLYNHVTVVFADFVGFTKLSEKLSPKELIEEVDEYFKAFDLIMEEHGLEKIKTIGDAYLAVCGLPNAVEMNGHNTIRASKAIMEFIDNQRFIKKKDNKIYFDIRIGVHSGPVIAGIVGLKKFAYDIWGDTVNTAARMEQSCEPNKINISDTTYQLIKDDFSCQYRGKIDAKNKGSIDMYYLE